MAVVMSMRWAGTTPEQYDTVRDEVRWEEVEPAGRPCRSPGSTRRACT
ncbi:hypothetical protein AB0C76_15030 [Kitasatospora sp. NPDC048722]